MVLGQIRVDAGVREHRGRFEACSEGWGCALKLLSVLKEPAAVTSYSKAVQMERDLFPGKKAGCTVS